MLSDLYSALLTLYAASSAAGIAYLALPDYRYRNSIAEYLEHRIRYKFLTKEPNGKITSASEINPEIEVQQCVERHHRRLGEEPEWLLTLRLILYLPRGHVPADREPLEAKKRDNNYANWFQKIPGKIFVRLYLTHRDNTIVTVLTSISLVVTVWILYDIVFVNSVGQEIAASGAPAETNAFRISSGIIEQSKKVFFIVGIAGLIVPAVLAAIGRLYICRHARNEIDVAVNKLLQDSISSESEEFLEQSTPPQSFKGKRVSD